jgi:hypothetical protein
MVCGLIFSYSTLAGWAPIKLSTGLDGNGNVGLTHSTRLIFSLVNKISVFF